MFVFEKNSFISRYYWHLTHHTHVHIGRLCYTICSSSYSSIFSSNTSMVNANHLSDDYGTWFGETITGDLFQLFVCFYLIL